MESIQAATK